MEEIWKDIKGYEGYQVSNLGRVKSLNFNNKGYEKVMKGTITKNGYIIVRLFKNSISKPFYVHRLVAEAFIDNPDNLPCVNHKSECRTENQATNLEWCDWKYNNTYGNRIKNQVEKRKKSVLQFDLDGNFIKEWYSVSEIERQTLFNQSNISKCCNGFFKSAYGYIWKYKKAV